MNLVDLKLPKEEIKKMNKPSTSIDMPRYPYWSRFNIDSEQMGKFPALKDAKIGQKVTIVGSGEIVEVRKVDRKGDKNTFTVEIQAQKMGIEPAKENLMKGSLTEAIRKSQNGKLKG